MNYKCKLYEFSFITNFKHNTFIKKNLFAELINEMQVKYRKHQNIR